MAKKTKIPVKLVKYIEEKCPKCEILEHRTVYTAIDAAATLKRKFGEIAKPLLVAAGKDYYLVLLPADYNLDFKKLAKVISQHTGKPVKAIKIPGEKIMANVLKIKPGALSAFGSFHRLPVVLDEKLIKAKKVVFSLGSFNHSVDMAVKDFVKIENALLGNFGVKKKVKFKIMPCKKKPAKKTRKASTKKTKKK